MNVLDVCDLHPSVSVCERQTNFESEKRVCDPMLNDLLVSGALLVARVFLAVDKRCGWTWLEQNKNGQEHA